MATDARDAAPGDQGRSWGHKVVVEDSHWGHMWVCEECRKRRRRKSAFRGVSCDE